MSQIIIYVDEGVGGYSLRHLVRSLRKSVDLSKYSLKRMDAVALLKENWESETALFIVPGGRDVFYHNKLKGEGVERISAYIRGGGSFLGICAGAYFGASEIEFEKGGQFEVCAKRHLGLFPGRAVGPALGSNKYHIESDRGAEAALVHWKEDYYAFTFYNGGCFFEEPERFAEVSVLGRYAELEQSPAAVVSCSVGKGRAILSGVHIEYDASHLNDDNPYFDHIVPKLKKTEDQGRRLFREVLEHVGLNIVRDN